MNLGSFIAIILIAESVNGDTNTSTSGDAFTRLQARASPRRSKSQSSNSRSPSPDTTGPGNAPPLALDQARKSPSPEPASRQGTGSASKGSSLGVSRKPMKVTSSSLSRARKSPSPEPGSFRQFPSPEPEPEPRGGSAPPASRSQHLGVRRKPMKISTSGVGSSRKSHSPAAGPSDLGLDDAHRSQLSAKEQAKPVNPAAPVKSVSQPTDAEERRRLAANAADQRRLAAERHRALRLEIKEGKRPLYPKPQKNPEDSPANSPRYPPRNSPSPPPSLAGPSRPTEHFTPPNKFSGDFQNWLESDQAQVKLKKGEATVLSHTVTSSTTSLTEKYPVSQERPPKHHDSGPEHRTGAVLGIASVAHRTLGEGHIVVQGQRKVTAKLHPNGNSPGGCIDCYQGGFKIASKQAPPGETTSLKIKNSDPTSHHLSLHAYHHGGRAEGHGHS